jgi:poly(A) polymerase
LDAEGLEASRQNRDGLTRLSRERVRSEWLKLLGADGAVPALAGAIMAGIAERVVPGPCRLDRLARLAGFEADVGSAPDSLLRLAALCVATPDDVARLRENLRLANDERDRLLAGLAARDSLAEGPPALQGLRTLLFNFGPRAARDGVLLAGAGTPADASLAPWTAAFGLLKTIDVPRLPVGGKDILAQGVGNGRRVGAILKRLQAAWIRANFPDSPSELARLLAEAIAAEE